mgnify:CR=1 FL=1
MLCITRHRASKAVLFQQCAWCVEVLFDWWLIPKMPLKFHKKSLKKKSRSPDRNFIRSKRSPDQTDKIDKISKIARSQDRKIEKIRPILERACYIRSTRSPDRTPSGRHPRLEMHMRVRNQARQTLLPSPSAQPTKAPASRPTRRRCPATGAGQCAGPRPGI